MILVWFKFAAYIREVEFYFVFWLSPFCFTTYSSALIDFHPQKNGWLGFILELEGVRIYHAGDTDRIPEMKNFEVDIALLPVSGTYVMTADQAIGAALDIGPKLAIPMHYGAIVGAEDDARKFKEALEGKVEVMILPKV